jgi:hypothetical protein
MLPHRLDGNAAQPFTALLGVSRGLVEMILARSF